MKVSRSAFIALLAGSTNAHQALRVLSDEAPIPAEFSFRIESNDPLAKSYKTSKSSKTSKTCPSDAPVANFGTWDPHTYSKTRWNQAIETDWFIDTDCGPRNQCYQAGDFKGDEDNCPEQVPVVDTDVEIRVIKKKTPEHHNGTEAIDHLEYTVLENKFNFEEHGVLTFDMFCSSELGYDTCRVWIRQPTDWNWRLQIDASGNKGWMSKTIEVPKGEVRVAWEYKKDGICSKHDDTMKLDNVKFLQYYQALSPSSVVADENLVIPREE